MIAPYSFTTVFNGKYLTAIEPRSNNDTEAFGEPLPDALDYFEAMILGVIKGYPYLIAFVLDGKKLLFYDRRVKQVTDRTPKVIPPFPLLDPFRSINDFYTYQERCNTVIDVFNYQYFPPTHFFWSIENVDDKGLLYLQQKLGNGVKRLNDTTVSIPRPNGAEVDKLLKMGFELWRDDVKPTIKA